jgi:Fic family protein
LFVEFLHLHPFSNGNGRVARLLLNMFLKHVLIVPVTLMIDGGRKSYLEMLMEAQSSSDSLAIAPTYVLICCEKSAQTVQFLMM